MVKERKKLFLAILACFVVNLRLGRATANGGLLVDWMVGQAIGSMGVQILRDQTDQFSFWSPSTSHANPLILAQGRSSFINSITAAI